MSSDKQPSRSRNRKTVPVPEVPNPSNAVFIRRTKGGPRWHRILAFWPQGPATITFCGKVELVNTTRNSYSYSADMIHPLCEKNYQMSRAPEAPFVDPELMDESGRAESNA